MIKERLHGNNCFFLLLITWSNKRSYFMSCEQMVYRFLGTENCSKTWRSILTSRTLNDVGLLLTSDIDNYFWHRQIFSKIIWYYRFRNTHVWFLRRCRWSRATCIWNLKCSDFPYIYKVKHPYFSRAPHGLHSRTVCCKIPRQDKDSVVQYHMILRRKKEYALTYPSLKIILHIITAIYLSFEHVLFVDKYGQSVIFIRTFIKFANPQFFFFLNQTLWFEITIKSAIIAKN